MTMSNEPVSDPGNEESPHPGVDDGEKPPAKDPTIRKGPVKEPPSPMPVQKDPPAEPHVPGDPPPAIIDPPAPGAPEGPAVRF